MVATPGFNDYPCENEVSFLKRALQAMPFTEAPKIFDMID
jgi:hypothetical protein